MVPISAFLYRSIPTKRLYLFTVALLVAGSAICGLAPSFSILLLGRIVQALGTGMLIPIGMILLPLDFLLIAAACAGIALTHSTGSLIVLALLYIPIICGSALIIGPVQSVALSNLTFEQNPHGVTVMSTGFQIAGCLGASLFAGLYSFYPAASSGFSASSLLAAFIGLLGLLLAFVEIKLNRGQTKQSTPQQTDIFAFMNHEPYSIAAEATALEALAFMVEKKTSGLPIVDKQGNLCGFISDGDIIRYMGGLEMETNSFAQRYPLWGCIDQLDDRLQNLSQLSVAELATKNAVSIEANADVQALFHIFADKRIKKVPVLQEGHLVGVVGRSDLLRQLVGQALAK